MKDLVLGLVVSRVVKMLQYQHFEHQHHPRLESGVALVLPSGAPPPALGGKLPCRALSPVSAGDVHLFQWLVTFHRG